MIYLALDTNIWLYLSNGYDPIANSYQKALNTDSHFELLYVLKTKVNLGEITILVNSVIITEWERNKEVASNLLLEVEKQKQILQENLKSLKPFLNCETSSFIMQEVKKEIVKQSEIKIKHNIEHIQEVETFLKHYCKKIPIQDKNFIDAAKLAVDKKAPFHHNKNNIADTIILLSVIDFIDTKNIKEFDHVIFVSNNVSEYAQNQTEGEVKFHSDIIDILSGRDLKYKRHLGEAIELSEDIIAELEMFHNYRELLYEKRKFGCLLPHCDESNSFGYLTNAIKVFNSKDFSLNPNQLTFFEFSEEERKNLSHIRQTETGDCLACGTSHAKCPNCKEIICDPDNLGLFICTECDSEFKIKYHEILKEDCLAYQDGTIFE